VSAADEPPDIQQLGNTPKVIRATCIKHGGARGFTNVVMRKRGGEIELDPHATGVGVLRLDEDAATVVRDTTTEWLG
jgi:hypothetical protein